MSDKIDEWKHGWLSRRLVECMDGLMNDRLNGWLAELMTGWIAG